jgi:hypothetical protein
LLELSDAAFDEVALGVEARIERVFLAPRRIVGDHGKRTFLGDGSADLIAVVGGVGHGHGGVQSVDQRGQGLGHVAAMPGGEMEAKGTH